MWCEVCDVRDVCGVKGVMYDGIVQSGHNNLPPPDSMPTM